MRAAPLEQEYGRLRVVQAYAGRDRHGAALALVECVPCAERRRVRGKHLRIGKAKSCGCLNRERVSLARRREGFRRAAAAWFRGWGRKGESMSGSSQPREISVPSAARRLGISDSAVRQAIATGRLRGRKDGGSWYVEVDSVASFRVSGRGPKPKGGRRPALHEVNVDGLSSEEIRELDEHAARLRAAKGAQAA